MQEPHLPSKIPRRRTEVSSGQDNAKVGKRPFDVEEFLTKPSNAYLNKLKNVKELINWVNLQNKIAIKKYDQDL